MIFPEAVPSRRPRRIICYNLPFGSRKPDNKQQCSKRKTKEGSLQPYRRRVKSHFLFSAELNLLDSKNKKTLFFYKQNYPKRTAFLVAENKRTMLSACLFSACRRSDCLANYNVKFPNNPKLSQNWCLSFCCPECGVMGFQQQALAWHDKTFPYHTSLLRVVIGCVDL